MESRDRGDRAYYSLQGAGWEAVGQDDRKFLRNLTSLIDAALTAAESGTPGAGPTPLELAHQINEAANRLFVAVASEDRDLRQVITTLRTALAVCWDMYSAIEAGQVSVREHMQRLRNQIEEFEQELYARWTDRAEQAR